MRVIKTYNDRTLKNTKELFISLKSVCGISRNQYLRWPKISSSQQRNWISSVLIIGKVVMHKALLSLAHRALVALSYLIHNKKAFYSNNYIVLSVA